ncbi:hypothetical protein CRE_08111 [Caenorhabditis remanei]|uniref:Uncharacterized protein n=1 Tax=Caenorhabditis remanei TaxID=31234 RepID=E3M3G4_CAERE|nr:hypothetical protein CRE_08111 [Caenorhabditis remanei]
MDCEDGIFILLFLLVLTILTGFSRQIYKYGKIVAFGEMISRLEKGNRLKKKWEKIEKDQREEQEKRLNDYLNDEWEKENLWIRKLMEKYEDRLDKAAINEQKLKAELEEKDAIVQKYKSEAEELRRQFRQSEEHLECELQEIVDDLICQEKRRRDEIQAERDEEEFDKLDEVSEDFDDQCEMVHVSETIEI